VRRFSRGLSPRVVELKDRITDELFRKLVDAKVTEYRGEENGTSTFKLGAVSVVHCTRLHQSSKSASESVDLAIPRLPNQAKMVDAPQATGSTYQAFSKDFASYQEVNAQAGPSKTTVHLDSQLPQDVVLDEDSGLVGSLMKSLEDQ
jgi:hypothetical protein